LRHQDLNLLYDRAVPLPLDDPKQPTDFKRIVRREEGSSFLQEVMIHKELGHPGEIQYWYLGKDGHPALMNVSAPSDGKPPGLIVYTDGSHTTIDKEKSIKNISDFIFEHDAVEVSTKNGVAEPVYKNGKIESHSYKQHYEVDAYKLYKDKVLFARRSDAMRKSGFLFGDY